MESMDICPGEGKLLPPLLAGPVQPSGSPPLDLFKGLLLLLLDRP